MGVLSWMQTKLVGKQAINEQSISIPNHNDNSRGQCKEEMSDWPRGALLAIGTLGNNNKVKEETKTTNINDQENSATTPPISPRVYQHLQSLKVEEVEKLHKEVSLALQGDEKDIINTKSSVGKKSFKFLLKKMFVCSSGFPSPVPSTPTLIHDSILDHSRTEKILRAVLHKKIHPQSSASTAKFCSKKYLRTDSRKKITNSPSEKTDQKNDDDDDGSKWVKTDSEYIVLEI